MVDTPLTAEQTEQQQTDQAWEVADREDHLPAIATAEYRGPSEAINAIIRGVALGIVGYYAGHEIGKLAERSQKVENVIGTRQKLGGNMWERTLKWIGAGILGFMGFQSGSHSVRDGKIHMLELQDAIHNIHEQNQALKKELKAQLRGRGKLSHFDEAWSGGHTQVSNGIATQTPAESFANKQLVADPSVDPVRDPKTMVSAADIAHEGLQPASQGVQL